MGSLLLKQYKILTSHIRDLVGVGAMVPLLFENMSIDNPTIRKFVNWHPNFSTRFKKNFNKLAPTVSNSDKGPEYLS